jgi:hypothetical protein
MPASLIPLTHFFVFVGLAQDARELPKQAIRLSRKDWLSCPNRAVVQPVPSEWYAFGILPRRLGGRGGASAVAAMMFAEPKEFPMSRQASKRQIKAQSNHRKTKGHPSLARAGERKATKDKTAPPLVGGQQQRSPRAGRAASKQARIIAMLRGPRGVTIAAITDATGWQQHSVRGFLAGVVRKKLGLTLLSVPADGGRIYRIADGSNADAAMATERA